MDGFSKESTRKISLATSIAETAVTDSLFGRQSVSESGHPGDYVVLLGGELFNKGAQAMTFTLVDQISKRFPEKEVYLFSPRDFQRPSEEKSKYEFKILPWGPEIQLSLLSPSLECINTTEYSSEVTSQIYHILSNAHSVIDINGYAFSSQMGFNPSLLYMTNILIAKRYSVPMYIFPQSIGPFNYSLIEKAILQPLMHKYLPYPEIICARENAGAKSLSPYTQDNVIREFDIALQNEHYDLENIYKSDEEIRKYDISSDAVGIVPNSKVFERTKAEDMYTMYEETIKHLIKRNKSVYILQHSDEDLNHCKEIGQRFVNKDDVTLITDQLNAVEIENVIEQFDFLIGSRYHSLIHAYKNYVPVLAIGWAVKYRELLERFQQSEYFFDGRKEINLSKFLNSVTDMDEKLQLNTEKIASQTNEIQQNNLFNRIFQS